MRKSWEKMLATHKINVSNWCNSLEFSNKDTTELEAILLRFEYLVANTEKTDTDWVQAQFEKYGKSDGMLWIAIRNPILTREILTNLSSIDLFLSWVSQEDILQRLSTLKEVYENK